MAAWWCPFEANAIHGPGILIADGQDPVIVGSGVFLLYSQLLVDAFACLITDGIIMSTNKLARLLP